MKIPSKTVTVVLASPEGDARLVFERLRYHRQARVLQGIEEVARDKDGKVTDLVGFGRAYRLYRDECLSTCVSVENLQNPDGSPVTPEQVRALDLYQDTLELIFEALQAADRTGAAAEKNGDSGAESSTASTGD